MNIEQKFLEIIKETLGKNSYIGDDCAYLKEFGIVITQDSLIEGVHFNLATTSPKKLGRKALLVNISDVLASGAKPKYLTIALSGKFDEIFIQEFYKGVNEICTQYNVEIIGGDLTGGDKLAVSICAIGNTKGRQISSRSNAKPNYIVAACGVFGEAELSNYLVEPKLFPHIAEIIATKTQKPYALMDSSDGLYDCLNQIAIKSCVGIDVELKKIPTVNGNLKTTLFGAEDYCLVGCFDKEDFEKIGDNLIEIGRVFEGEGVLVDGLPVKEDVTYEHKFKN